MCDEGWIKDHESGMCLLLVQEPKTWSDAKNSCEEMDSRLVTIGKDNGKHDRIYETCKNTLSHKRPKSNMFRFLVLLPVRDAHTWSFWIGANAVLEDGNYVWRWSNGVDVDMENEHWVEPFNPEGKEFCMDFLIANGLDGLASTWNDNNCSAVEDYLCEKPMKGLKSSSVEERFKFNVQSSSLQISKGIPKSGLGSMTTMKSSIFNGRTLARFSNSPSLIGRLFSTSSTCFCFPGDLHKLGHRSARQT